MRVGKPAGGEPAGGGEVAGVRVGLVVAAYNDVVTDRLREGALAALRAAGVGEAAVVQAPVPGAFEVPQAALRLASTGVDAVIGLGCLIRGETPHFDVIAAAVAQGLTRAALDSGVPMAFGVLTTNTVDEALARAGADRSNKGWEAADAALAMVRLYRRLGAPGAGVRPA